MCGIGGIVAYRDSAPPVDPAELRSLAQSMAKRGPDGEGIWTSADHRTGFAHRRLAIIDLTEGGAQPMCVDGLCITYNGEIYNYRILREELLAQGVRLRSESDTEVLLQLYRRDGAAMVHKLRGMYAFAIWDDANRTLFAARDPFGIKPLYYADSGGSLRFASQVKALIGTGKVGTEPEPAGHVGFFVLGSVPEPYTMYRTVHSLPAGATLTLRRGQAPCIERFFRIGEEFRKAGEAPAFSRAEMREKLAASLKDSVRHHMVSDVPVGIFLSSGLDSSTIAALACEVQGSNLHSVTLGFEEYRGSSNDETDMAAATASQLRTVHTTKWIRRDAFENEVENALAAMDQPTIDGINTYFVSKVAAESGMKVALSGLGGDELFGGYPSFRDVPRMLELLRRFRGLEGFGRLVRRLTAPVIGCLASPKYAGLLEYGTTLSGAYLLRRALYMPWEVEDFLDPRTFAEGWARLELAHALAGTAADIQTNHQRISALEFSWYMRNQLLRDADWAGMAHSLEIRTPLVDIDLFRAVAPLLAMREPPTKHDMALAPSKPLAPGLLSRPKTGFVIPVDEWSKRLSPTNGRQRQLRHWAQVVHRPYKRIRVLALLSDAFGGHGGIALYNRDLLTSICSMPECGEVVALPRVIHDPLEELPAGLTFRCEAANSKWRYLKVLASCVASRRPFDVVLCCHLNLLPLALIAKAIRPAPVVLFIFGIDAWHPRQFAKQFLLRRVDRVVSISDVTRRRFQSWSRLGDEKFVIIPNAIHSNWYGPGQRSAALVERYQIQAGKVLMTLGRLAASEQYKGFDEVIEVLPDLVREIPGLTYLIVGDGSDRGRLERKAKELGIASSVRFTGVIPESEKADHYRLADAFVMPSRGEGFGFVLLEAMACGIPAVASSLDGGLEAVRHGQLGIVVNPSDPEDIKRGIRDALERQRGAPPEGLEFFEFSNFRKRATSLVSDVVAPRTDRRVA